jgi:hypothetical protein
VQWVIFGNADFSHPRVAHSLNTWVNAVAASFSKLCVFYASDKEKPHSLLRNCGVYLVAWSGIEPLTRGFSTHLSKLRTVLFQASAAF